MTKGKWFCQRPRESQRKEKAKVSTQSIRQSSVPSEVVMTPAQGCWQVERGRGAPTEPLWISVELYCAVLFSYAALSPLIDSSLTFLYLVCVSKGSKWTMGGREGALSSESHLWASGKLPGVLAKGSRKAAECVRKG